MPKSLLDKDAEIVEVKPIQMEMYVVINHKGQYFRAKGYGGGGQSWVDDIGKAKIYGRIGPARSTVTFFSNDLKYPKPMIGVLGINTCTIVDESARVEKVKNAKESKILKRALAVAEKELASAMAKVNSAQRNAEAAASKAAEKVGDIQRKLKQKE